MKVFGSPSRRLRPTALLLLLLWGIAQPAIAGLEFKRTKEFTLNAEDIQARELWLSAEDVAVYGSMEQTLFATTGHADLAGHFLKDIWISARDIVLSGHVRETARLASRQVTEITGRIDASLMAAAARTIKLEADAVVGSDAVLAAPHVLLHGVVQGRAGVWAKRAIITGRVEGDLYVRAEEITFLRGAHIGGNLTYAAPRELVLDRGIHVGGAVTRQDMPVSGMTGRQHIMVQLFLFSGALATGLVFSAVFPRYTGQAVRRVRRNFWNSTLIGALAFFLLPAIAVLAILSVVGIPVGVLVAILYAVLLYLAKIVVGLALGGVILQRRGPQPFGTVAVTLAVGLLFLYILAGLPIVGSVGTITIMFVGLGGLILGLADVQYGQRTPHDRGVQRPPDIRAQDTISYKP